MTKPIKIQVRFSDLDILGHVNNSVYLSYFEIARVAFFSPLMGLDWDWQKKGVLIKKNEIEYFSPILLHQEPEISIYTRSIGTKSFILEYDLYVREKLYTTGSSVLVCYDSINQTTINIPKEMRQVLVGLKRNDS